MSIRLGLLQAVRKARVLLEEAAVSAAGAFVRDHMEPDGGFRGRSEGSDLYYSAFALTVLVALEVPFARDKVKDYLDGFTDPHRLDLVHLASLIRCRALLGSPAGGTKERLWEALRKYQTHGGGFAPEGEGQPTAYGCFLGLGAFQDLQETAPFPKGLRQAVQALRCPTGGYANDPRCPVPSVPATAACLVLAAEVGGEVGEEDFAYLRSQRDPRGGFRAAGGAPAPDLLSTATALYALARWGRQVEEKELFLDFLSSLWSPRGGFLGCWANGVLDCEYTFYGLLAAGSLAAGSETGSTQESS